MSLGIVIKGPEGLVLAADSRVTLSATTPTGPLHVTYDNATKLLAFGEPNSSVGVVTYGQAAIGLRTAHSFLPEFQAELPDQRLPISEFANRLRDFYLGQWQETMPLDYHGPNMTFVVGGFDKNQPYGDVYQFEIPRGLDIIHHHKDGFGVNWGGQREFVDRLLQGYDASLLNIVTTVLELDDEQLNSLKLALGNLQMPVPLQALALQDCVDLAIFFLRTTISAQNLTVGIRGVGGPIDVAIITRQDGLQFVQRKDIKGELGSLLPSQKGG